MTKSEQEERAFDLREKIKLLERGKDNTTGLVLRSTSHLFGRFKDRIESKDACNHCCLSWELMLLKLQSISQGSCHPGNWFYIHISLFTP